MLVVEGLSKVYRSRTGGDVVALDDVAFSVAAGEIVGLLGPNGAGKTTTIKSVCGLVQPSAGRIIVDGIDALARPRVAAARLAAVLEGNRNVLWRLTVRENLEFFAALHGIPARRIRARIDGLIERFGLEDKSVTPAMKLSRGMQQKLALACAVVPNTPLLLLDEPTLGLDVEVSHELRAYLEALAAEDGRAVLLSSHDMSVVSDICQRVVIISSGRVVADDRIDNLVAMFRVKTFSVRLAAPLPPDWNAAIALRFDMSPDAARPATYHAALTEPEALYDLMDELRAVGAVVETIESADPDLEDIFLSVIKERQAP